jgi:hypothetical protein
MPKYFRVKVLAGNFDCHKYPVRLAKAHKASFKLSLNQNLAEIIGNFIPSDFLHHALSYWHIYCFNIGLAKLRLKSTNW